MRKYITIILSVAFLVVSLQLKAQDKFAVRGKVVDDVTNEVIIGATVVEVSEGNRFLNGTITDFNGDFVLEVTDPQSTIKISFIGYVDVTIPVEGKSYFNVRIKEDVKQLAEATVVATRMQSDGLMEIAERNLTSSSVKVDMQEMTEVAATSAEEAIQGQVSGVDIIMNSGDPGGGSSIVIRGMSSLDGGSPLFVVNGIPQTLKTNQDLSTADVEDIGDLVSIPPANIKSITVLKDAAATAPYGSEGANGVIVIETLEGKKGPTVFNYMFKSDINEQPAQIPMLDGDDYVTLQLEQRFNRYGWYTVPDQLANDPNYRDFWNYYNQNTNWVDEVTQTGVTKEHNVSVSGGGDKTRYFTSVNFLDQPGTNIETSFNRLASNTRVSYDISDRLTVELEFNYNRNLRESTGFLRNNNILGMAYKKMPNMSIWEYDQNGVLTGDYFTPIDNYQGNGVDWFNPVALAKLGEMETVNNNISTNFSLLYNIYKTELKLRTIISYIYDNSKFSSFLPYNAIGTDWLNEENNTGRNSSVDRTQLLVRNQLIYNKQFNKDNLINAGFTLETKEIKGKLLEVWTTNSASVFLTDPAALSVFASSENIISLSRKMAGRFYFNYTFKDRYIANVNFALEGSSKFGSNERWGIFPSGSLAWRFGSEPFLESQQYWLGKETKLKLSYGYVGDDSGIGVYSRHAAYSLAGTYIDNNAVVPSGVQLDNLKWSTSIKYNFALDAMMFNNKVDFVAEYYNETTIDELSSSYDIASSSGYSVLRGFNGGEIQNRGWEIQGGYWIKRNKTWNIKVNANISNNRNRILSLPDNFPKVRNENLGVGAYPQRIVIGTPVGSFYGLEYHGVYARTETDVPGQYDFDSKGNPLPYAIDASGNVIYDASGEPLRMSYNNNPNQLFQGGDAIYLDYNKDGTIDKLDAIYLGNANPFVIGGFGGQVKYKRFEVKAQFFYRVAYDIVNMTGLSTQQMRTYENQSKAVLHRWRSEGQDFDDLIPRAYYLHNYNSLGSDRFVEDGTFLRLNNVSIIYEVPKEFSKKLGMNDIRISLNGRKLLTWTGYTGQDPEVGLGGGRWNMGIDNSRTPVPKKYSVSINVKF